MKRFGTVLVNPLRTMAEPMNIREDGQVSNLAVWIRRFAHGLSFLAVFLCLVTITMEATSVPPKYQEVHERNCLRFFISFALTASLAAILHGISRGFSPPCVQTQRCKWIVRAFYYGLLLVGPVLLSEGHVFHVKAKGRAAEIQTQIDGSAPGAEFRNPYRNYQAICDVAGMGCLCGFLLWTGVAFLVKLSEEATRRIRPASRTAATGPGRTRDLGDSGRAKNSGVHD